MSHPSSGAQRKSRVSRIGTLGARGDKVQLSLVSVVCPCPCGATIEAKRYDSQLRAEPELVWLCMDRPVDDLSIL